jgi:hypothetical protein
MRTCNLLLPSAPSLPPRCACGNIQPVGIACTYRSQHCCIAAAAAPAAVPANTTRHATRPRHTHLLCCRCCATTTANNTQPTHGQAYNKAATPTCFAASAAWPPAASAAAGPDARSAPAPAAGVVVWRACNKDGWVQNKSLVTYNSISGVCMPPAQRYLFAVATRRSKHFAHTLMPQHDSADKPAYTPAYTLQMLQHT